MRGHWCEVDPFVFVCRSFDGHLCLKRERCDKEFGASQYRLLLLAQGDEAVCRLVLDGVQGVEDVHVSDRQEDVATVRVVEFILESVAQSCWRDAQDFVRRLDNSTEKPGEGSHSEKHRRRRGFTHRVSIERSSAGKNGGGERAREPCHPPLRSARIGRVRTRVSTLMKFFSLGGGRWALSKSAFAFSKERVSRTVAIDGAIVSRLSCTTTSESSLTNYVLTRHRAGLQRSRWATFRRRGLP